MLKFRSLLLYLTKCVSKTKTFRRNVCEFNRIFDYIISKLTRYAITRAVMKSKNIKNKIHCLEKSVVRCLMYRMCRILVNFLLMHHSPPLVGIPLYAVCS